MGWGNYGYYGGWRPYVPVAQRRANAARAMAKMMKKTGQAVSPVVLDGRTIARTFWGKAWCDNLEAYSDYANRLPRGRTYIRNGSVVDLQISEGKITSCVSGSELYKIEVKIKPLPQGLWKVIQTECAGKIDSLIELLQGKLSSAVMQVVTRQQSGLFPSPKEIDLDCSCPDWADLCKHVAATLYGVGARLDQKPELLFLLRGVDPADLISRATAAEIVGKEAVGEPAAAIAENELAGVFGIDLDTSTVAEAPAAKRPAAQTPARRKARRAKTPPPAPVKPARRRKPGKGSAHKKDAAP
ncbi:MAG: SWIM zinc finger family protein [Limisphaerales bacterium]